MPGGRTTLYGAVKMGDGVAVVPLKCACNETAHICIGEALTPAEASPGDTKFLRRWLFSFDETLRLALHGEIVDSTSLVGLALAALRLSPPR